ncbi:hypothetical protein O59_001206 [Cellvibrio sp. BR]|uniref:hypothetical protein n=1 Tax=Cellvibrio sp. BR TaxID=1134474 RepID=UPI00026009D3|nr:hypothetical protein [Cellvibrio sp. BR]EIK42925.1 hypothetical protein O59_001206 [Cellvibrio sp. BR]
MIKKPAFAGFLHFRWAGAAHLFARYVSQRTDEALKNNEDARLPEKELQVLSLRICCRGAII